MPAGIIVVPAKQFGPGTHTYVDYLIESERRPLSLPYPTPVKKKSNPHALSMEVRLRLTVYHERIF